MSTMHKGFELVDPMTPPVPPEVWGEMEFDNWTGVIDTLVNDCLVQTKDALGHKHTSVYNGYGEKVIDAGGTGGLLNIGVAGGYWNTVDINVGSNHPRALRIHSGDNDYMVVGNDISPDNKITIGHAAKPLVLLGSSITLPGGALEMFPQEEIISLCTVVGSPDPLDTVLSEYASIKMVQIGNIAILSLWIHLEGEDLSGFAPTIAFPFDIEGGSTHPDDTAAHFGLLSGTTSTNAGHDFPVQLQKIGATTTLKSLNDLSGGDLPWATTTYKKAVGTVVCILKDSAWREAL